MSSSSRSRTIDSCRICCQNYSDTRTRRASFVRRVSPHSYDVHSLTLSLLAGQLGVRSLPQSQFGIHADQFGIHADSSNRSIHSPAFPRLVSRPSSTRHTPSLSRSIRIPAGTTPPSSVVPPPSSGDYDPRRLSPASSRRRRSGRKSYCSNERSKRAESRIPRVGGSAIPRVAPYRVMGAASVGGVLEGGHRTEETGTGISTTRRRARIRMIARRSLRVPGRWGVAVAQGGVAGAQEGVRAGTTDSSNCKISISNGTRSRIRRHRNTRPHNRRTTTLDFLSHHSSRLRRRTTPNTDQLSRRSPRLATLPPSTTTPPTIHNSCRKCTIPIRASLTSPRPLPTRPTQILIKI